MIGNSEFPDDPGELRSLLGPPTDVPALSAALTDPDTGLHRADAVRTVLEATTQRVKDELAEFFGSALPHEQLFLYYSGHGLLDLRNRLRLCASDTTLARLQARSVELGYVNDLIEDCAARSIVVVLDCCFSGAATAKGTDPTAQLAGHGRFVMTSSSHGGVSADAEAAGMASPFTRHLVTGLRSGAPGRDGLVTAFDVYRYVHGRLRSSGQIPHMKTQAGVGAIPLARRRARQAGQVTADRPDRDRGHRTGPFDVRPIFTDREGNQSLLASYTDFSGVLHVPLSPSGVVLTTHRDEIMAAAEGVPVTAGLYRNADITWREAHSLVNGRKVADLRADNSGDAVSFVLPGGEGTVKWQKLRVSAFRQATSQGRWPGTPLLTNSTTNEYRADRGYRHLKRATWWSWLWLMVLVAVMAAHNALSRETWYGNVGRAFFVLVIIFSLLQAVSRRRDAWRFLLIRSVLRAHGLYVIQMGMTTGTDAEDVSDGFGVTGVKRPYARLRYDGVPEGDPDAGTPEMDVGLSWVSLKVPLHSVHLRDIVERSDRSGMPAVERVEVIGSPRPGCWVIIRTSDGMLWPRAKAH
ncbi:caspase family protein [Streptomyces sp. NBC_00102]|uniref:caspase family protein n=1 Tax=Streptomyces sp. NBC_00102 TaxID=2975652 RepID=UPI00224E3EBC|nr:caspase family protein [Streptomyces sp. NBC_00102]MCX5401205.1 caspase family protein [Streptomyces sp. NBC_00102]